MTDKKYNGWTNYETWSVALLIDQCGFKRARFRLKARISWEAARKETRPNFSKSDKARFALADWLKDEYERLFDHGIPRAERYQIIRQLADAALSEVDWHSVADYILEGAVKRYQPWRHLLASEIGKP